MKGKISVQRTLPLLLAVALLLGISATYEGRRVIAVSASGAGVTGNGDSFQSSMTADGRQVAFRSIASDLVPGITNDMRDIFIKDVETGDISRISVSPEGAEANAPSEDPDISADGRFVVFVTAATNLAPGTSGAVTNIVMKDRADGSVTLVSADAAGIEGNGNSDRPAISADGRYVAFNTEASNLAPDDTNGLLDVYVKDTQTGAVTRASVSPEGQQGNGISGVRYGPVISADGTQVAFSSAATNLHPGDADDIYDVLVKNMETGEVRLASVTEDGVKGNGHSVKVDISADGDQVVFRSVATNLDPADTDETSDAYHKDLITGKLTLASSNADGVKGNEPAWDPSISPDGKKVAFTTKATNLVAGAIPVLNIYMKHIPTGAVILVTAGSDGAPGNGDSANPSMNPAGSRVIMETQATNLIPREPDGLFNIYMVILEATEQPPVSCFW
ncbi:MAG: PD40 domain-containing protein [Thermoleophilia bacterium]|nr:PD40 domain-containing protein [Thermoleophilia bacterium]